MSDYLTVNQANWDNRARLHAASADYAVSTFESDPAHLSGVVRFDLPLLGDIRGLRGVHLQCHIGTDTLSLSRLGARMTGLDFSPTALAEARRLARQTGAEVDFVEADVYRATQVLEENSFDLVYTGVGALCWLPSIDRWAEVVAALLKPGGRLFIREDHPLLWAASQEQRDGLRIVHPYFEREEPLVWDDTDTYVTTDEPLTATTTHEWNHGMGEIVTALLRHGMQITGLVEHQSAAWEALPGQMVCGDDGEWRLVDEPWRMPLSYTMQAVKR